MNKIILNCEFITPAFIYDANGNLELRATSIKGVMRFWWRALHINFKDYSELKNEESKIFGGKIKDDMNREFFEKSKVNIIVESNQRVKPSLNSALIYNCKEKNLSGLKYLYYSMINSNKYYYQNGYEFKVIFEYLEKNKEYVYEYLKAFNYVQLFGGIGGRSKRGAGNFVIKSIENINDITNLNIKKIKEEIYREQLKNSEDKKTINDYYKKILSCEFKGTVINQSNITNESCKILKIEYFKDKYVKYDEWYSVLNKIGLLYKECRKESASGPKRGKSPLIIKLIRQEKEYKIILIELAGSFDMNDKDVKKEIAIINALIEKCSSECRIFDRLK